MIVQWRGNKNLVVDFFFSRIQVFLLNKTEVCSLFCSYVFHDYSSNWEAGSSGLLVLNNMLTLVSRALYSPSVTVNGSPS